MIKKIYVIAFFCLLQNFLEGSSTIELVFFDYCNNSVGSLTIEKKKPEFLSGEIDEYACIRRMFNHLVPFLEPSFMMNGIKYSGIGYLLSQVRNSEGEKALITIEAAENIG